MNIREGLDLLVGDLKANSRSKRTIDAYKRDIEKFIGFIGEKDISNLSLSDINEFINSDSVRFTKWTDFSGITRERSPSSVNRLKCSIRKFLSILYKHGHLPKDFSSLIEGKSHTREEPVYLTDKEIEHLSKEVKDNPRDRMILELFLNTGLRLNELSSLNVGDVRDKDRLAIRGKGDKVRYIPLNKKVKYGIKKFLRWKSGKEGYLEDSAPLFLSNRGKRIKDVTINWNFTLYRIKAGIEKKITPHSFRHTFASMVYRNTKDITDSPEFCGKCICRQKNRF